MRESLRTPVRLGVLSVLASILGAPVWAGEDAPGSAEAPKGPDMKATLDKLGVTVRVTERPRWPKAPGTSVEATLVPQVEGAGTHVVSLGLPLGPDWLGDDKHVRVLDAGGDEIPAFSKPLVHWWINGKRGTLRSALVQFEASFKDKTPQKVTIALGKPRTKSREAMTPMAETQVKKRVDPPEDFRKSADSYDYQCPKVLALLPPEWLCASLLTWQQVPAKENKAAEWFDKHLAEKFDSSLVNISANRSKYEAHLFDRPATYAKIYVRFGEEKHLLAALKANDYYIQHLGPDGFFDVKKAKDSKYTYSEGSAIMYMLTGDERYRESVDRALSAWTDFKPEHNGRGFWTERHAGFGMMAFLHAYEVTGEQKHLDTAKRYFEAVFSMQVNPVDKKDPDGAWVHAASSHGEGNGWTTSPWMSCFLTDSIWKYWMLAGDPRCPASLAMYAKFTEKHSVTPDGRSTYYMANSPGRGRSVGGGGPEHNVEGAYLMVLGHYLSGGEDKAFLRKVETLWPPVMQDGANNPGRKFNWRFRETSMLIWWLVETPGPSRSGENGAARINAREEKDR